MKKNRLFLLIMPAILSSLTGCSSSKDRLTYGTYIEQIPFSVKDISNEELASKAFNENETFLLAVHQGTNSEDCTCFTTFQYVIANYMNIFHERIYMFNAQLQDDSVSDLKINKSNDGELAFYIFKGAKKIAKYSYKNKKDTELFSDWYVMNKKIRKFVNAPKMYYVDDEYLKNNLEKRDQSVVAFIRNKCGDCNYVIPSVIIPYIDKYSTSKNLLLFDMQETYDLSKSDTATDEEKGRYQALKDYYGLSESGNATYGYGQGVIPTIQYYEKNVLKDATVFFNDAIAQNDDGSFSVSQSFYTDERLPNLKYLKDVKDKTVIKGLKIENQNIIQTNTGGYYWSQKDAAKYHTPLLKAFLDSYLL